MFGVNFDVCRVRNSLPLMFRVPCWCQKAHSGVFGADSGAFSCSLTRRVCLNTRATFRGSEDLQQERVADLSSPAPWNCSADAFQSCIIAETVAKEPVARAFSWKCWRKSQKKYSRAKWIPVVYRPCANVLPISSSLHKTKTIYSAFSFFLFLAALFSLIVPLLQPLIFRVLHYFLFFFWSQFILSVKITFFPSRP